MDIVYKHNYKYIIAWIILFSGFVFCFLAGVLIGEFLFVIPFIFAYILFFLIPHTIVLNQKKIVLRSLLIDRNVKFSEIKEVKSFFSSKSLIWHAGDENKTDMLCQIKVKGKPFAIVVFGDWITNYKELFHHLVRRLITD